MPGVIPRPARMRGLCARYHAVGTGFAFAFGIAVCSAYYVYHFDAKRKKTRDFWASYDPYEHFEAMCKKNLLHTCPENLKRLIDA